CQNTIAAVSPTDQTIAALMSTDTQDELHLLSGESFEIQLGHGQHVIDIPALRLGQDCQLTIKGFDDTVAVFRIAGAFRIGTRSKLILDGIKSDNLLWTVSGAGRLVRISSHCDWAGTLLAAKRLKISIGAFTKVEGALIGKRIRMGRESKVVHHPFIAL